MSAQFGQFPDIAERPLKKCRSKPRKSWVIECKVGDLFGWSVSGRYKTREIRDAAFVVLTRKAPKFLEYKIPRGEAA